MRGPCASPKPSSGRRVPASRAVRKRLPGRPAAGDMRPAGQAGQGSSPAATVAQAADVLPPLGYACTRRRTARQAACHEGRHAQAHQEQCQPSGLHRLGTGNMPRRRALHQKRLHLALRSTTAERGRNNLPHCQQTGTMPCTASRSMALLPLPGQKRSLAGTSLPAGWSRLFRLREQAELEKR